MRIWDPLGGHQEFSILIFWRVIKHPTFLLFVGLTLILFFATDPLGNRAYVPLWGSAVIWPIAFIIYIALYAVSLAVLSVLTSKFPRLRTPTPLLGFLTLIPPFFVIEVIILDLLGGGTYPSNLQGHYLFYFLSVQVCEAVFYRYILPSIPEEDYEDQSADSFENELGADAKHVIIDGERIPLSNIHLIEAREHHVHVTLSDSQRRLRARLGDIIAQTSPSDGVQTHRSWWVARHAAKELSVEDGRPVLRLNDNFHIPVARTRIGEVRTWAQNHLMPASGTNTPAE